MTMGGAYREAGHPRPGLSRFGRSILESGENDVGVLAGPTWALILPVLPFFPAIPLPGPDALCVAGSLEWHCLGLVELL